MITQIATGQGRAGGNGYPAADDGIGAQMIEGEIGDMHTAPAAFAIAVFLAEQLGDGPEDMIFNGSLQKFALSRGRTQPAPQAGGIQFAQGQTTLGDAIAMPAMRAGDIIQAPNAGASADGGGFLADGKVGGATIIVVGQGSISARPEFDDHLLEFADDEHIFQQLPGRRAAQSARLQLTGERALILIAGNHATVDLARGEVGP